MIAGVLEDSRRTGDDGELENRALAAVAGDVHTGGPSRKTTGDLKVDLRWADVKQRHFGAVDINARPAHAPRQRKARGLQGRVGKVRAKNSGQLARRHPGRVTGRIGHGADYGLSFNHD